MASQETGTHSRARDGCHVSTFSGRGVTTETYKDWHEKLPFALHAYQTGIQASTRETPYSLIYGMEAVLSIEVEIPSLQVLKEVELEEAEWVQARYEQLN